MSSSKPITKSRPLDSNKMNPAKANIAVFVFVPGAWHPTNYLEPIRTHLHAKGHESIAIGHKTLDSVDPGDSVLDDAAKVEQTVQGLLNAGKDVILVMHSYGGQVGSQAIGHLLSNTKSHASDDKEDDNTGKILHLFYVTAMVPLEGETGQEAGALISAANNESGPHDTLLQGLDIVDGKLVCKEEVKDMFYHDLAKAERDKYFQMLQGMPAALPTIAITHTGWDCIPSTYVYALRDRMISLPAQKCIVARANKHLSAQTDGLERNVDGNHAAGSANNPAAASFRTAEIDSDHCSMFILSEHVEKLTQILITVLPKI